MNSLQPHKAEKIPELSLDALREVSSDQMNTHTAPESAAGTDCSPELDPHLVFWKESIRLMRFVKKSGFLQA